MNSKYIFLLSLLYASCLNSADGDAKPIDTFIESEETPLVVSYRSDSPRHQRYYPCQQASSWTNARGRLLADAFSRPFDPEKKIHKTWFYGDQIVCFDAHPEAKPIETIILGLSNEKTTIQEIVEITTGMQKASDQLQAAGITREEFLKPDINARLNSTLLTLLPALENYAKTQLAQAESGTPPFIDEEHNQQFKALEYVGTLIRPEFANARLTTCTATFHSLFPHLQPQSAISTTADDGRTDDDGIIHVTRTSHSTYFDPTAITKTHTRGDSDASTDSGFGEVPITRLPAQSLEGAATSSLSVMPGAATSSPSVMPGAAAGGGGSSAPTPHSPILQAACATATGLPVVDFPALDSRSPRAAGRGKSAPKPHGNSLLAVMQKSWGRGAGRPKK